MGMSFLFTVGIISEKGRAAAFEKGRGDVAASVVNNVYIRYLSFSYPIKA